MRIFEKGILDLTGTELRQCRSLSLRQDGYMCEDLTTWREFERQPNRYKRKSHVWLIKDNNDRLIAWALATPRYKARGYDAQFYTRKSERGKGLASLLMEKVLELDPRPHVIPHDKTSGCFFKKHKTYIRFDKYDGRWLK